MMYDMIFILKTKNNVVISVALLGFVENKKYNPNRAKPN